MGHEKEGMKVQNKMLLRRKSQEAEAETKSFKTETANENKNLGFRLFCLGDEEWDIEVMEVDEVDFEEVKRRLEGGKSIFISAIQEPKMNPTLNLVTEENWFFTHT
jgi:hypothetical protein